MTGGVGLFVLLSFMFSLVLSAKTININKLTSANFEGFGLSLCYVAAIIIVAYYFDRRRSFATGISVCGSGVGKFIFLLLCLMRRK